MKFDWTRIFKRARELQPDILLSGSGPDIRWVGNEAGKGRETEWCVQGINDTNILFGGRVEGLDDTAESLGSIEPEVVCHFVKVGSIILMMTILQNP